MLEPCYFSVGCSSRAVSPLLCFRQASHPAEETAHLAGRIGSLLQARRGGCEAACRQGSCQCQRWQHGRVQRECGAGQSPATADSCSSAGAGDGALRRKPWMGLLGSNRGCCLFTAPHFPRKERHCCGPGTTMTAQESPVGRRELCCASSIHGTVDNSPPLCIMQRSLAKPSLP